MIFQRLARAIREQNWLTVALEMAIVVIGILIGLQVDDWNQRRLERKTDQRALTLFVDELQLMIDEAVLDREYVATLVRDLTKGIEVAMSCEAQDDERSLLITAIAETLVWRVPDVRPSGLAEIGNSGTLSRLGNPDLSRAVGDIHQTLKAFDDSMVLIGPQFDRAWQMLAPYLVVTQPFSVRKLEVGVEREQTPAEYMSLVAQQTICGSQEFVLGLSFLENFFESQSYSFDEWHRALTVSYELASEQVR